MNVKLVTTASERDEIARMVDAYYEYKAGWISQCRWDEFPREIWLDCIGMSERPFVVYDNQDGLCFVEEFKSLAGAILYASGAKLTCENSAEWDNEKSLGRYDLVMKVEEENVEREKFACEMVND